MLIDDMNYHTASKIYCCKLGLVNEHICIYNIYNNDEYKLHVRSRGHLNSQICDRIFYIPITYIHIHIYVPQLSHSLRSIFLFLYFPFFPIIIAFTSRRRQERKNNSSTIEFRQKKKANLQIQILIRRRNFQKPWF